MKLSGFWRDVLQSCHHQMLRQMSVMLGMRTGRDGVPLIPADHTSYPGKTGHLSAVCVTSIAQIRLKTGSQRTPSLKAKRHALRSTSTTEALSAAFYAVGYWFVAQSRATYWTKPAYTSMQQEHAPTARSSNIMASRQESMLVMLSRSRTTRVSGRSLHACITTSISMC